MKLLMILGFFLSVEVSASNISFDCVTADDYIQIAGKASQRSRQVVGQLKLTVEGEEKPVKIKQALRVFKTADEFMLVILDRKLEMPLVFITVQKDEANLYSGLMDYKIETFDVRCQIE